MLKPLLLLSLVAAAAQPQPAPPPLRPYLMAIGVPNLDESAKWYEEKLGFHAFRTFASKEGGLRVAFMEANGFVLELVENKKNLSFATIRKQNPSIKLPWDVDGFGKLAFLVDDVPGLAARLKGLGVQFQIDLRDDQFGKWFIVRDNSGNMLEFMDRRMK